MNNGFGTGVYFSTNGLTQSAVTGSLVSFDLHKQADKKEITDGNDNFLYVGITKRKKTVNCEVLFTGSGSALTIPNIGDTATLAYTLLADNSGSWGVTDSKIVFKKDDAAVINYELTQWTATSGSLP